MNMMESTLSTKGQTTMPARIRAHIGACAGTRLVWHGMTDGSVLVRAKNRSVLDLAGSLKAPKGKHVVVEDMSARR